VEGASPARVSPPTTTAREAVAAST